MASNNVEFVLTNSDKEELWDALVNATPNKGGGWVITTSSGLALRLSVAAGDARASSGKGGKGKGKTA